jgi:type I restriction enzyme S subunit
MSNATTHIDNKPSLRASHCEDERRSKRKQSHPLVPELRFNEFENDWIRSKLGDATKYVKGFAFKSDDYQDSGVRIVRVSDLAADRIKSDNDKLYIDEQKALDFDKYKLRTGNIVITTVGSKPEMLESAVGRGIYIHKGNEGLLNQNMLKFENIEGVSNGFIIGLINSRRYQHYMKGIARGNANQANITVVDLLQYNISYPSLPEQQKIASFLSAVDEKIQQLTKKKALLEDYKKGVMQQLFSGQLRFKDENGKAYPDWDWVGGNELFDNISDKKHNSDLPILAITQDQGAIPRELINYQMTVTEASVASYKVVQKGDFIISLRTFQGGIEFSDYHGICSPAYNILRPNSENVDRAFYRFYLKTSFYIRQLQKNLEGIRDGKMISYKYFSEIKVPFPSKLEQQKIASYLSGIDTKIEAVTHQINQTQTFKKGLLQQLFV